MRNTLTGEGRGVFKVTLMSVSSSLQGKGRSEQMPCSLDFGQVTGAGSTPRDLRIRL